MNIYNGLSEVKKVLLFFKMLEFQIKMHHKIKTLSTICYGILILVLGFVYVRFYMLLVFDKRGAVFYK